MESERIIEAETVQIKTCSVQIKALVIGKKQMTLSVFRQLPRGALICRKTGRLLGEPWGYVRYYWDGCGEWAGAGEFAIHAVWQKGGVLLRDLVRSTLKDKDDIQHKCEWLDYTIGTGKIDELENAAKSFRFSCDLPEYPPWPGSVPNAIEEHEKARKKCAAIRVERLTQALKQHRETLEPVLQSYYAALETWDDSFATVRDLGQLFIAV